MTPRRYIRRLIEKNRILIRQEADSLHDFMDLLMKHRNTGVPWTREEKQRLKLDLMHLSLFVPGLIIFLLPGGSFLLPFLAEGLDLRRGTATVPSEAGQVEEPQKDSIGDHHPFPAQTDIVPGNTE